MAERDRVVRSDSPLNVTEKEKISEQQRRVSGRRRAYLVRE